MKRGVCQVTTSGLDGEGSKEMVSPSSAHVAASTRFLRTFAIVLALLLLSKSLTTVPVEMVSVTFVSSLRLPGEKASWSVRDVEGLGRANYKRERTSLDSSRKAMQSPITEKDGYVYAPGLAPILLNDTKSVRFIGRKVTTGWAVDTRCINATRKTRTMVGYGVGCGTNIDWDLGMVKDYDFDMFLFDPTPKAIRFVTPRVRQHKDKMTFTKEAMGSSERKQVFTLPKSKSLTSATPGDLSSDPMRKIKVQMNTMQNWMARFGHEYVDVLKLDIEGSEYEVLEHMIATKWFPFTQLLVEFHARFLPGGREDPRHQAVMDGLKANGFRPFYHRKGGEEYCFIRIEELAQCVRELQAH